MVNISVLTQMENGMIICFPCLSVNSGYILPNSALILLVNTNK
jgi:hypothetical protein